MNSPPRFGEGLGGGAGGGYIRPGVNANGVGVGVPPMLD
jgi:hypothetical protein